MFLLTIISVHLINLCNFKLNIVRNKNVDYGTADVLSIVLQFIKWIFIKHRKKKWTAYSWYILSSNWRDQEVINNWNNYLDFSLLYGMIKTTLRITTHVHGNSFYNRLKVYLSLCSCEQNGSSASGPESWDKENCQRRVVLRCMLW